MLTMPPSLPSSFSSPPRRRRHQRLSQTEVCAPQSGAMDKIEGVRRRRGHIHETIFERNHLPINRIKETLGQSVPIAKPRVSRTVMLLDAAAFQRRSAFHLIWTRRSPIRWLRSQKQETQTKSSVTMCAHTWQTRCHGKTQKRNRGAAVGHRYVPQNRHHQAAREIARKDTDFSHPWRNPA
jgi:hypothetical protein